MEVQRHAADGGATGAANMGWSVGELPVDLEGPLPSAISQLSGHDVGPGCRRRGRAGGARAAGGQHASDHHDSSRRGDMHPHQMPDAPLVLGHARDGQAGTLPHSGHAGYWVISTMTS